MLRFLRGYVRFVIIGDKIENFFNDISRSRIRLWNTAKIQNEFLSFTTVKNYKKLRPFAKKAGIKLRIKKKRGFPFITHKYRKRFGIIVGITISGLFLLIMSQFLWSIEVHGNGRINPTDLIKFMSEMKIKPGVSRRDIDVKDIERAALLKFSDISWISINICGSRANIEIKERIIPPQQIDEKEPCNIIAGKSGWIKYIEVYDGQKIIGVDNFVYKGQLIVSGIIEDGHLNNTLKHSRAKIIAEVEEILTVEQPLTKEINIYKDKNKVKHNVSLEILGLNIPLSLRNTGNDNVFIETNKSVIYPKIFNFLIPLSIHKSESREIIKQVTKLSEQQAKLEAEKKMENVEKTFDKSNIKIIDKNVVVSKIDGAKYVLQNKYTTQQDIAVNQEILFGDIPAHQ